MQEEPVVPPNPPLTMRRPLILHLRLPRPCVCLRLRLRLLCARRPCVCARPRLGVARPAVVFVDEDGEPFDAEAYFDPDYGPPEGEDAWLAQVASPVADEYLAAHQPPAGVREVLAAGFTHRDREPGARGWAAGGTLDVMEPGPALAGFADDAISGGLPALTDDELIGVLGAARRLASRAASVELAAVADLSARREAHAAAARDRRQAEHAGDEIAAALTLTCRAADKLLGLAVSLARLPAVHGRAGRGADRRAQGERLRAGTGRARR